MSPHFATKGRKYAAKNIRQITEEKKVKKIQYERPTKMLTLF